ncbi:MAG TPA: radical SAM protein [Polyangiaceae bacterium]|nr:radical SAM protein [Polyangiaceae bacterium]
MVTRSLRRKLQTAARFALAATGSSRQLLGVGWEITRACNARCPFCARFSGPKGPDTALALRVIDELAKAGCQRVHLTGGEPLLRDDLPQLLDRIRHRDMQSSVNTNGTLLSERADVVERADTFLVSVDGPQPTHDAYRGARAFERLMRGIDTLQASNRRFAFYVALFKQNLTHLDFFVDLAKEHGTYLVVQPGFVHRFGSTDPNPETPELPAYRAALSRLREPDYRPYVWNSDPGLDVLMEFPRPQPLRCHAGRVTCRIEVDGSMYPCAGSLDDPRCAPAPNVFSLGVAEAFRRLSEIDCSRGTCWAAHSVEKNLIFGASPGAVWNLATRDYMSGSNNR